MVTEMECPLWVKSGHSAKKRDVRFTPKADIPLTILSWFFSLTQRYSPGGLSS